MPQATSFTSTAAFSDTAGAIDDDMNLATAAGAVTLVSGVGLGFAVGSLALPAPVLGVTALGGGLIAAGKWNDIKAHFTGDDAEKPADNAKPVAAETVKPMAATVTPEEANDAVLSAIEIAAA